MENLYYLNIFNDKFYKIDDFYKVENEMIFDTILNYYYKIIHEEWYGDIKEIALEEDISLYPAEVSEMYYIKTEYKYVFVFVIANDDFINEYNKRFSYKSH